MIAHRTLSNLDWDLRSGCFGGGLNRCCPEWIHHDVPVAGASMRYSFTDVQTRDCARFKNSRVRKPRQRRILRNIELWLLYRFCGKSLSLFFLEAQH
ncbi:hypothetical protein EDE15_3486 [Edaphobacter aggregans]|uniref:Uncharacterized protein n=1 Tax=Edaphobacter aggregans TaxID=570835 RepID=A0A428MM08_9BACT|nr:hypothetical protein EDE15_3486 [Edaphobacter aggregans]